MLYSTGQSNIFNWSWHLGVTLEGSVNHSQLTLKSWRYTRGDSQSYCKIIFKSVCVTLEKSVHHITIVSWCFSITLKGWINYSEFILKQTCCIRWVSQSQSLYLECFVLRSRLSTDQNKCILSSWCYTRTTTTMRHINLFLGFWCCAWGVSQPQSMLFRHRVVTFETSVNHRHVISTSWCYARGSVNHSQCMLKSSC